jgi:hypothetical protein
VTKKFTQDDQLKLLEELMDKAPESGSQETEILKAKRGRPSKAKEDKAKFVGMWLTPEIQKAMEGLPFGRGPSTRLKVLLDFYYENHEREKALIDHISKILKKGDETLKEVKNNEEGRAKITPFAKEFFYLKNTFSLSENYLFKKLSKEAFKRYQKMQIIWREEWRS